MDIETPRDDLKGRIAVNCGPAAYAGPDKSPNYLLEPERPSLAAPVDATTGKVTGPAMGESSLPAGPVYKPGETGGGFRARCRQGRQRPKLLLQNR